MFNFKPKKVFEKINKMDRKQAYTIGAIVVVLVIALLLLISAAGSGDDESFAGMNARGYDLAQMPFATDEAEKYLLANAYPDMKENGSTLLYSAEEKEQRQEEDAAAAAEESSTEEENDSASSGDGSYEASSSGRGYGGYAGGGGSGRGKTEIGQLSSTGMASASGSGVSSIWPLGDFHQFKGREDRGNGAPVELKTADGRRALAQFRSGSMAASRINENKLRNAGKAVFGGDIRGSDAFGKDGAVDLSKLQSGGLTLDTSAPATTTDLSNLDKKVADAAKKAEDKKKEEDKKEWWEEMLINLAKSAAETLVNAFMSSVGDTISANIQANNASRNAKNSVYRADSDRAYANLTQDDVRMMTGDDTMTVAKFREQYSQKQFYRKWGKDNAKTNTDVAYRANEAAAEARQIAIGQSFDRQQQQRDRQAAKEAQKAEQKRLEQQQELEKQRAANNAADDCRRAGKVWNGTSCDYQSL